MQIKLTHLQTDSITVLSLRQAIYAVNSDNDPHETPDNKAKTIAGLYTALQYFMVPSEYKMFILTQKDV